MAYHQTPSRANIEFLKSSAGLRGGRTIRLNYGPQVPPPQLQGRIDPVLWADFMHQVEFVANKHPYLVKPGSKEYSNWLLGAAVGKTTFATCVLELVVLRGSAPLLMHCRSCHWPLLLQSRRWELSPMGGRSQHHAFAISACLQQEWHDTVNAAQQVRARRLMLWAVQEQRAL